MVFFYPVLPFISQSPQPTVLNGSHTLSTSPPPPPPPPAPWHSIILELATTTAIAAMVMVAGKALHHILQTIGIRHVNSATRLDTLLQTVGNVWTTPAQNSPQAAAFLATANGCPDYQWYHDTGCNHHVTNELENLNVRVDAYNGPNQINGGNGQGLRILRTGTATLPSSIHNFRLSSLLHVPQIEKSYIR
jgi:hypothetical protein